MGVAAASPEPPPTALTAVRHAEDSEAAFRCRQAKAAGPLGLTFEQCDMKSFRQADRSAFSCALVGRGAWALTAVEATCGEAVVTSDTMTRMRDDRPAMPGLRQQIPRVLISTGTPACEAR